VLIASAAVADEYRYDCRRIWQQITPLPANGTCEIIHDSETGYARIYLPEPGLEALGAGILVLAAISRRRR